MKCPCNCIESDFAYNDCLTSPGATPQEGDCGMCYHCGGWWEIKNGEVVQYQPTSEELLLAMNQAAESKRRFKERGRDEKR